MSETDAAQDRAVPNSGLYPGRVTHRRLAPVTHALAYRVFSLLLDIDALPELDRRLGLFGYNRAAPLSFHDRDHGPRDGGPLRPWVESALAARGLAIDGGPIRLLCFPRLWGYVFNPLSVYYCYRSDGGLHAVVYEVANTFGEQHAYVLGVDRERESVEQTARKVFHVSPFLDVAGGYRFRISPPGERLAMTIRHDADDGTPLLIASHRGRRRPLSDRALAGAVLRHPLMTVKVIAAIYTQAFRLWRKQCPATGHPGWAAAGAGGIRETA